MRLIGQDIQTKVAEQGRLQGRHIVGPASCFCDQKEKLFIPRTGFQTNCCIASFIQSLLESPLPDEWLKAGEAERTTIRFSTSVSSPRGSLYDAEPD